MAFPEYAQVKPAVLIKATLDLIHEPGDVFEVRIPKTRAGTIAGYFQDTGIAAALIARENTKHQAIYMTVNPLSSALIARSENKFEYGTHFTSSDSDVIRRKWFLMDFDAVRIAGISASDEELTNTASKADEVLDWLRSIGWPEPIIATSGNGIHFMFRTDDPNDDPARVDYEMALKMLSSLFSDQKVKVDVTVFNASRVWKIYGTVSAKGSSTEERPHRVAMITKIPKKLEILTRDQIENVARPLRDAKSEEFKDATGEYIADMVKWLTDRMQTVISGPRPMFGNEGQKWIISKCPFNADHQNPMVGLVSNRPVFRCLHDSCSSFRWKEFREKIDPSFKDPDTVFARLKEWCDGDQAEMNNELVESAARTGKQFSGILKKLKTACQRSRVVLAEDLVKEASKRFRQATIGDNNDKNNLVGLINRTRTLQSDGIVPAFWIADYDHRIRTGTVGDINAPRLSTTDEIQLLVKFHSMGDSWVRQVHCSQIVQYLAEEHRVNPLRVHFKHLNWDGTKRLDSWLVDCMGTKDTAYTRAIGRKWMISAIARAMEPGCQADHMLIFEGAQGIGKTQSLRILGGQFYCEYAGGMSGGGTVHKDMVATMAGKVIIELSELATTRRSEMETLKAIITTAVDDVRLSYERDSKSYPRTGVFAGTTNEVGQAYIQDVTGARRFWPTYVGELKPPNTKLLREIRDELWAEAVVAYEAGEDWWTAPIEEVLTEQLERQLSVESSEPWYGKIRSALTDPDSYAEELFVAVPKFLKGQEQLGEFNIRTGSMNSILGKLLMIDTARQSAVDVARVQKILRAIGFKKIRPSRPWMDSTYAYDLTSESLPHLWSSIDQARKTVKFPRPVVEPERE